MTAPVPQAAIDALIEANRRWSEHQTGWVTITADRARFLLEAAGPFICAAERKRLHKAIFGPFAPSRRKPR